MNKEQYLTELRRHLARLPDSEREDILRDQEEYLRDAIAAGRSEQEVIESLGHPRAFAAGLIAELRVQQLRQAPTLTGKVRPAIGVALAILALAPLNFIIAIGPALTLFALLVSGWTLTIAVVIASLAFLVFFFAEMIFVSVGAWTHLSGFFFALGGLGTAVLLSLLMFMITRWMFWIVLGYLQWNFKIIRKAA